MTQKSIYSFLLFLFLTSSSYSQSLSLSEKYQSIATLGKIWGFLQYHHPNVAAGNVDWDQKWFNHFKTLKEASNQAEVFAVFESLFQAAGKYEAFSSKLKPVKHPWELRNIDHAWIRETPLIPKALGDQLYHLTQHPYKGKNHWVKGGFLVKNPRFLNEKEHTTEGFPEESIRLLALMRYWNAIEYYFPYRYLIKEPWNEVLLKSIPAFLHAGNEADYHLALRVLVRSINDTHSFLRIRNWDFGLGRYIPNFYVKQFGEQLVVYTIGKDSSFAPVDIQIGDELIGYDGKPIEERWTELAPYFRGSNEASMKRDGAPWFLVGDSVDLSLRIRRKGEIRELSVPRYRARKVVRSTPKPPREELRTWDSLASGIGYLNMGKLARKNVRKSMRFLKKQNGLIIDLRKYPKGTVHFVASHLKGKNKPFMRVTVNDYDQPGRIKVLKPEKTSTLPTFSKFKGPVLVLVGPYTQSHGEYSAMVLQSYPQVRVMGSQTAGADGNVSRIMLPGAFTATFTGVGIYYPDGEQTQQVGIRIDEKVLPTAEGVRTGRDEVLEAAVLWMKEKLER